MRDSYMLPSDMAADGATWRIEWEDNDDGPSSRTTTLTSIAWYAHEFDDTAEVARV
jgi:hypothetical protein